MKNIPQNPLISVTRPSLSQPKLDSLDGFYQNSPPKNNTFLNDKKLMSFLDYILFFLDFL